MTNSPNCVGLIPSRLASERLPGKALALIEGIPVVIHAAKRAQLSKSLTDVFVCSDSVEIESACHHYNVKHILTSNHFQNGAERISSVAPNIDAEYFIDIQGDEPLVNPGHIDTVAEALVSLESKPDIIIPTLPVHYTAPDTIVRVQVTVSGRVMTLSRGRLPHAYKQVPSMVYKHLSVIGFRRKALLDYAALEPTPNECSENIELLRALENDFRIYSIHLQGDSFSVDVHDDLNRARVAMKSDLILKQYQ